MNNNPLAKTIRNAFIINVANKKTSEDASYSTNTIGNILRHKRITIFEKAINRFFISSGLPPVKKLSQFVDEKNLLTFSLQLSGYIRDSQKELANLRNEDATDPNLINLYNKENEIENAKLYYEMATNDNLIEGKNNLAGIYFEDENYKKNRH